MWRGQHVHGGWRDDANCRATVATISGWRGAAGEEQVGVRFAPASRVLMQGATLSWQLGKEQGCEGT